MKSACMGPFKCCVSPWGGGIRICADQRYKGLWSNIISIMRYPISRKTHYIMHLNGLVYACIHDMLRFVVHKNIRSTGNSCSHIFFFTNIVFANTKLSVFYILSLT